MFELDFDRDMGVRLVLTARRTAHRKQARRETSAQRRAELGTSCWRLLSRWPGYAACTGGFGDDDMFGRILTVALAGALTLAAPGPAEQTVNKPVQAAYIQVREIPDEDAMITAALEAQGYFRPDVPLSYDLQDALHTACERYGVDYHIALGLINVESNFNADALNPQSGCYGLMQLHPDYFPVGLSPAENIEAGIACLGEKLERYGSVSAALTAYHDGYDSGQRKYSMAVLLAAERWRL